MKDQEMLNELIIESREHLESIEPDLLELEEKGSTVSDELINRIFRAVHSIKGGFGFIGIEAIVKLSHAMENVMSRLRDKDLEISSKLTDALLQGIDKLRTLLDDVSNADSISINEELHALNPFLSQTNAPSSTANKTDSVEETEIQNDIRQRHPDLTVEHILDVVRNGRYLYQVMVDPQKNLNEKDVSYKKIFQNWERFGDIVVADPSRETLEKRKTFGKNEIYIVFSTVLEPDLISQALDIPLDQIFTIDISHYKERVIAEKENTTTRSDEKDQSKSQQAKEGRYETRIEEALRVKVGLLNNLMNFAGELVLARNQLIQTMNHKLSDCSEIQKAIQSMSDEIQQRMQKVIESESAGRKNGTKVLESEMNHIKIKIKDLLNLQLRDLHGVNGILQNIDMVTTMLQEGIMQTRMQPISVVFSKFPRIVRDLAKKMNKEIQLIQFGQEVELDKSIIELLSDPLTHLIRNCVDHGIELPHVRKDCGKSTHGEIILRAYQEGGKVIIDISDDGAGIDPDVIRDNAVEKGIINKDKAQSLTVRELQMLIFAPGFSTAKVISDVSGRGVGMDVVKTNIERLGGTIEVDSEVGKGTRITMKLPLTLAIIPSLIVQSENRRFAVPQVGLEEVVRIRAKDISSKIERVHHSEVLRLRGKLLPLVRLSDVLGLGTTFVHPATGLRSVDRRKRFSDRRKENSGEGKEHGTDQECSDTSERRNGEKDRRQHVRNAVKVVVLRMDKKLYGLIVDDVQDSEEIVVKPLPDYLKASQCYAGATIMGDGRVAMILDPNGIATMAQLQFEELEKELAEEKKRIEREDKKKLENMLLFSIGGAEQFAIDLSEVSRIEKRKSSEIEYVGNKEFLKYDHMSLRLFRIENYLPVQPPSQINENIFVIVPKWSKHAIGIVTTKVEDTVETELCLEKDSIHGPGVSGATIINNKMTVVIDVPSFLDTIEADFVN